MSTIITSIIESTVSIIWGKVDAANELLRQARATALDGMPVDAIVKACDAMRIRDELVALLDDNRFTGSVREHIRDAIGSISVDSFNFAAAAELAKRQAWSAMNPTWVCADGKTDKQHADEIRKSFAGNISAADRCKEIDKIWDKVQDANFANGEMYGGYLAGEFDKALEWGDKALRIKSQLERQLKDNTDELLKEHLRDAIGSISVDMDIYEKLDKEFSENYTPWLWTK